MEPSDLEQLKNNLRVIIEPSHGNGQPSLVDALGNLDEFLAQKSSGLDPKIKHYLERRSYAKALDWVLSLERDTNNA